MGLVKFVNLVKVNQTVSDSSTDSVLDKSTVVTKFKDVLGLAIPPGECTIHIDSEAIPAVNPTCRVPQALGDI
jgi:hypothetical protein